MMPKQRINAETLCTKRQVKWPKPSTRSCPWAWNYTALYGGTYSCVVLIWFFIILFLAGFYKNTDMKRMRKIILLVVLTIATGARRVCPWLWLSNLHLQRIIYDGRSSYLCKDKALPTPYCVFTQACAKVGHISSLHILTTWSVGCGLPPGSGNGTILRVTMRQIWYIFLFHSPHWLFW